MRGPLTCVWKSPDEASCFRFETAGCRAVGGELPGHLHAAPHAVTGVFESRASSNHGHHQLLGFPLLLTLTLPCFSLRISRTSMTRAHTHFRSLAPCIIPDFSS